MLKNKMIGKKIRNITILLLSIAIMIGIYKYIDRSQAEKVIEINTIITDNYGFLSNQEIALEAKQLENGSYEVELPQSVNNKTINKIVSIFLNDSTGEKIEAVENKIHLTKEQVQSKKLNLEIVYDVAVLEKIEEGKYNKILLAEKSLEEIQQLEEITKKETTEIWFYKTLRYEDKENGKLVELKGYLPENAEIQVNEVSQEQISKIFKDKKIKVAYDIKIMSKVIKEIPIDEANPNAEPEKIEEILEINPENYGEVCEVTISDASIAEKSQVYHVKEDNTYEKINVKENTEGNVSFEAQTFSVYAVGDGEIVDPDPGGTETGGTSHPYQTRFDYTTSDGRSGSWAAKDNGQYITIKVPYGGSVTIVNQTYASDAICIVPNNGDSCVRNHAKTHVLTKGLYTVLGASGYNSHTQGTFTVFLTVSEAQPPKVAIYEPKSDWRNSALSVSISATSELGLSASNQYEYFISTSETQLLGGAWANYSNGTIINLNPTQEGIYYIFAKKIKDTANVISISNGTNVTVSGTEYHRFGPYQFDYTRPEWSTENLVVDKENNRLTIDLLGKDALSGVKTCTLTTDKISIYIDGEKVDGKITKILSEATAIAGGIKYQLTIPNLEETTIQEGKQYKEWSGNIKIKIDAGTLSDGASNLSLEKNFTLGHVDTIRPDFKYTYSTTDIDHGLKTVKAIFSVTDKFFQESKLTIEDLTITVDGKVPDWTKVKRELTNVIDIKATINGVEKVVGKQYTLVLSDLEQRKIAEGQKYLDYSGYISIDIPSGKVTDTSGNTNIAQTITIGVDKLQGNSKDPVVVDVVSPLWEKVSTVIDSDGSQHGGTTTATIKLRATDKFFGTSNLTTANLANAVKVISDGTEITSGIIKTIDSEQDLTEERTENGITTTVQYGKEYTITVKGFPKGISQVKIQIPKGTLVDKNNNQCAGIEIMIYNALKSAESETTNTSPFLGESVETTIFPKGVTSITPIERQNIEKVVFVDGIEGSVATEVKRVWDVSEQGDDSIIAWTSQDSAPYTVYIGSKYDIFANSNSSYLFSYIGASASCTATETIKDFDKIKIYQITNMTGMFNYCGYNAMTSLNLPESFDTTSVTNMSYMFNNCGYNALTSLILPQKFNTENVTNMSYMFNSCGYKKMTKLNLGDNFDTSKVATMSNMFSNCGYTALTSLDLKNKFKTERATNMINMFYNCGATSMRTLSLGPLFTRIAYKNRNFIKGCGASDIVIYAPESIYANKTTFKINKLIK